MSPLTAIRQWMAPELRSVAPPQMGQPNAAGTPIPTAELKALGSQAVSQPGAVSVASESTFGRLLGQMVQDVNAKQAMAAGAASGVLAGENVSLHQAVIAMEEASVSFQLMVEVRNKLLESYQELMRMQV